MIGGQGGGGIVGLLVAGLMVVGSIVALRSESLQSFFARRQLQTNRWTRVSQSEKSVRFWIKVTLWVSLAAGVLLGAIVVVTLAS